MIQRVQGAFCVTVQWYLNVHNVDCPLGWFWLVESKPSTNKSGFYRTASRNRNSQWPIIGTCTSLRLVQRTRRKTYFSLVECEWRAEIINRPNRGPTRHVTPLTRGNISRYMWLTCTNWAPVGPENWRLVALRRCPTRQNFVLWSHNQAKAIVTRLGFARQITLRTQLCNITLSKTPMSDSSNAACLTALSGSEFRLIKMPIGCKCEIYVLHHKLYIKWVLCF